MRLGIHEHAQEAAQFLLLGGGIVLLARIGYVVIASALAPEALDPLAVAATPYQQGYLLRDPHTVVNGQTALEGRIAFALLSGLAMGATLAAGGMGLAKALGKPPLQMAIRWARAGILAGTAWGAYSALVLPPKRAVISAEGLLLVHTPAVMGTLSLPWPAEERLIPWSDVRAVSPFDRPSFGSGCERWIGVEVVTRNDTTAFAAILPQGPDCRNGLERAQEAAEALAAAIRPQLLSL